eukprot:7218812-Pyramimonas_sp.AAC.1
MSLAMWQSQRGSLQVGPPPWTISARKRPREPARRKVSRPKHPDSTFQPPATTNGRHDPRNI